MIPVQWSIGCDQSHPSCYGESLHKAQHIFIEQAGSPILQQNPYHSCTGAVAHKLAGAQLPQTWLPGSLSLLWPWSVHTHFLSLQGIHFCSILNTFKSFFPIKNQKAMLPIPKLRNTIAGGPRSFLLKAEKGLLCEEEAPASSPLVFLLFFYQETFIPLPPLTNPFHSLFCHGITISKLSHLGPSPSTLPRPVSL